MAPTRTPKARHEKAEAASSQAGPSKQKAKKKYPQKEPNGLQGVQKIKSMLRQARRLLAKDKLAADVKVTTERRIKSLEAELAQAEAARKERNMATKYHKIKFFERQKVTRKINQVKRGLVIASGASKTELESVLYELRVDLNYIIYYPKSKRYISLFPPEIRENSSSDATTHKVNPEAEEVRSWIRTQMESGPLPTEPELHWDKNEMPEPPSSSTKQKSNKSTTAGKKVEEWTEKKSKTKDPAGKGGKGKESQKKVVEEKDDFFEDDDDEEDGEEEESDSDE